ncbi:hypothetical protein XELAEV_18023496mg [Xenopus laevis]|uniref:Reverse transcriptase domain-containing protein n=1 Tax=Xenopus laevis TaxID=8355 RepID=A0A974D652_XENLA|nr:hypothetical protein XELAEV_18023496mg [Xenopus laevis]
MGSNVAPSYANLFMAQYEDQHIYKSEFWQYILGYYRYIDDLFFLWQGDESSLVAFIDYLNNIPSTIRFTASWSKTAVSFLDIMITYQSGKFKTSIFRKSTDRNNLLHATSFHPPALIKALPYSQMLRVKRITSETEELGKSLTVMADRFRERGYTQEVVDQALVKVNTERQRRDNTKDKKVFVTKYTTASRFIKHIVQTHWHHLQTDAILGSVCQDIPMFAYKRGKNLRDVLVKADNKSHYVTQHFLSNPQPGNFRCYNCSVCNSMLQGTSFAHPRTAQRFQIKHRITCQSTHVIYMIVCPCGLYYIGKTIQKLKDRFLKHKSVIKIGKDTTPLVTHCREHNHNISSLRLMGIDQIISPGGGVDKNTLLLRREAEWIFRLDTVTPMGLNDTLNLSCFLQTR